MKFDPKIFINAPYIACPKCTKAAFGVLAIHDQYYVRRCAECWVTREFPLSPLRKTVIYLDQFAISNMTIAIDPKSKANIEGKVDPFWKTLFEKLDLLSKLQVIVCPDSSIHERESRMTAKFPKLKRLYEQLSQGTTFREIEEIKVAHVRAGVEQWMKGKASPEIDLDPARAVHGSLHRWTERLLLSVDVPWDDALVDEVRSDRNRHSTALNEIFAKWQGDKGKPFNYWLEEERDAFGKYTLYCYFQYLKKAAEIHFGVRQPSMADIVAPPSARIVGVVQAELKRLGVQETDLLPKTAEYLRSDFLKKLTFVEISAHLYAALARRAAGGQKRVPSTGMPNDIDVISTIMPYCDAIMLDNECFDLLSESPLKETLKYKTKVFCQKNRDEFLKYLDSIEAQVTPEHRREVAEVYGGNWLKPYSTIFTNESIVEENRSPK